MDIGIRRNDTLERGRIGISDILAMYVLIWSVTPIMASGTIYRVILVLCVASWMLIHFNYLRYRSNMVILICLLLASTFVLRTISGGISHGISWTINIAIYSIIALIGSYYLEVKCENVRSILIIMMICTAIISVISIQTVIADPTALRIATHEWSEGTNHYGAYDYVYMCVQGLPFFFLVLRVKALRDGDKLWTVMAIVSLVLSGTLIIFSGFTLANIISLVAILMCILFINPSTKKTLTILFVGLIVALTYKFILTQVFEFLALITSNSPMYTRKIMDLSNQLLYGTGVGSTYIDRVSRYLASWQAIARYPIMGSILWSGSIVCGGHSTLVDVMAYGGVLYALLYYWQMIIFTTKQITRNCVFRKMARLITVVFLTTCLLTGLFDTLTYANAWIWFLFIPYLAKRYSIRLSEEELL